ncbi:MAG: winged helix-turn-helix domain-containing protein [Candidatus Sungbacteria bacterium]|nr:winged helix-turn-helix domain-containing protein [Candidatus Sungbacteria bacterium]
MAHIPIQERDTIAALRQAVKRSDNEAQKTRIRAIISLKEGKTRTYVAQSFVVSRTSVISWITLYNEGGTDALKLGVGGRPEGNPKWDTVVFENLAKEIDKGGYWSVPRMRQWLKEHHKKDVPEQTVWYRMRQLNYSYKSARPHPVQGNKERQAAFKKGGLPHFWSR